MAGVEMSSIMTVKLIDHMATDLSVIRAAQVSVDGDIQNDKEKDPFRFINYLMKHRDGRSFEHNAFTFFVEAPLFVFREWQQHRSSSFNEMSDRYTKLLPKFYTPGPNRPLVLISNPARPVFEEGSEDQKNFMVENDAYIAGLLWKQYERRLNVGIAPELARTILPLSVYSQMYWTVNARALMNFLSLRIESDESTYHSYPQREIMYCAEEIERHFSRIMPHTHKAFVQNGRVGP